MVRMLSSQCAISLEKGLLFKNLQSANEGLTKFSEASARFVPAPMIKLLGKQSVVDVKIGESVNLERTTILFSDIRAFTTISEQLSPEQNFAFLNELFARMAPSIRKYNGFIDKFIGDSIMAIFPVKRNFVVFFNLF